MTPRGAGPGIAGRLRWAVVRVRLDPVEGHEQGGARRALVVSNEPFHRSGRICVVPISAARETARYPAEVPIVVGEAGQTRPGVILCHQVRTIALDRVASKAPEGYLAPGSARAAVRAALAHHLGLDIPAVVDGARVATGQAIRADRQGSIVGTP